MEVETVVDNDDDSYGHEILEWDSSSSSSEDSDDDAVEAVIVDDEDDDDDSLVLAEVVATATPARAAPLATPSPAAGRATVAKTTTKNTTSLAHDHWVNKTLVLFHVDIETGGPDCGIVQLSCIAHDCDRNELGRFDEYVKPNPDAIWSPEAMSIHKIRPHQDRIKTADNLPTVWARFKSFCEMHCPVGKVGMFVAWGGKTCDCQWLFIVTEETHQGVCVMPERCDYFMDPMKVIEKYTGCELNQSKSHVTGYGCGEVWCYVMDEIELPGAHSSIVDAQAQMDIVTDDRFWKYRDKSLSCVTLESVWQVKRKKRQLAHEELTRRIPPGWSHDIPRGAKLGTENDYNGPEGGPPYGPTAAVRSVCASRKLDDLFLFFWNESLLQKTADETNRYGTEDWVKPRNPVSHDLNDDDSVEDNDDDDDDDETTPHRNYQKLVHCDESDPGARHRFTKKQWRFVTKGYMLVFFGIILIRGAVGIRRANMFWNTMYNTNNPTIQNAMTRDAFDQMRRCIHFVNNSLLPGKDSPNYSPLNKVSPVIKSVMENVRKAWTLGWKLTIDESMIKYMGSFVPFVQYMPAKPIKHGIKVFAMCCAFTGYLYAFEVYTGKEDLTDGSALAVVNRLMLQAMIAGTGCFRILYTDNFYTSLALMKSLYVIYKMYMVGTFRLTKKKSRTAEDFAFHKLSPKALKFVNRGWSRVAFRNINHRRGRTMFTVQATIWRDKKIVGFLHNFLVERPNPDHTVLRWSPHLGRKRQIRSPTITSDYVGSYNAVDRKDRDTADWTVSFKGDRWYMRVVYWQFDGMIYNMFQIVIFIAEENGKDDPWHVYLNHKDGRYKFQMDLALALIARGITMDWPEYKDDNPDKKTRPPYMRHQDWIPCGCGICFFCVNGFTHGVAHEEQIGRKRKSGDISMKSHPDEPTDMFNKTESGKKASSHYCDVCIHSKRVLHPGMKLKAIKALKDVHSSTKGCDVCKMFVCQHCWPSFSHIPSDYRH